jgi:hypothetical protein
VKSKQKGFKFEGTEERRVFHGDCVKETEKDYPGSE